MFPRVMSAPVNLVLHMLWSIHSGWRNNMADNISSLVKEHHAFYEVSPYYVEVEERPLGRPVTARGIQAGFNIDVYGVRTEDNKLAMPRAHEYALGYAELKRLTGKV